MEEPGDGVGGDLADELTGVLLNILATTTTATDTAAAVSNNCKSGTPATIPKPLFRGIYKLPRYFNFI